MFEVPSDKMYAWAQMGEVLSTSRQQSNRTLKDLSSALGTSVEVLEKIEQGLFLVPPLSTTRLWLTLIGREDLIANPSFQRLYRDCRESMEDQKVFELLQYQGRLTITCRELIGGKSDGSTIQFPYIFNPSMRDGRGIPLTVSIPYLTQSPGGSDENLHWSNLNYNTDWLKLTAMGTFLASVVFLLSTDLTAEIAQKIVEERYTFIIPPRHLTKPIQTTIVRRFTGESITLGA